MGPGPPREIQQRQVMQQTMDSQCRFWDPFDWQISQVGGRGAGPTGPCKKEMNMRP